ncbi:MAG: hypothetical protein OXB86_00290 [Bdellovibrionales bacterium]|nr:hypothetical protein [Bdellovibrionales bacterium]
MTDKKQNDGNKQSPEVIVAKAVAKAIETVAGAVAKAVHKLPGKSIVSIAEKALKVKDTKQKKNDKGE